MIFLRFTPLVPNWFVNLASPIVGMPFLHFSLGTFFGKLKKNKQNYIFYYRYKNIKLLRYYIKIQLFSIKQNSFMNLYIFFYRFDASEHYSYKSWPNIIKFNIGWGESISNFFLIY